MSEQYSASIKFGPVPEEIGTALVNRTKGVSPIADKILEILSGCDELQIANDGIVYAAEYDASYGLSQWGIGMSRNEGYGNEQLDDLEDVLTDAGWAWDAQDDGKYEIPGSRWFWRPGMGGPRATGWDGDSPVMSLSDWQHIRDHSDPTQVIIAVNRYFGETL